jgi:hypothetical protein
MIYFKEKTFTSQKGHFPNFVHENHKKIETPQNKEKCFFQNSIPHLPIQNYMKHSNFEKFGHVHFQWVRTRGGQTAILVRWFAVRCPLPK